VLITKEEQQTQKSNQVAASVNPIRAAITHLDLS
jgi:hypothetical protein